MSRDCSPGLFNCREGNCIDMKNVCDGTVDCENGSDELGKCNVSCNDHPCEQKCYKTPSGPVCGCRDGYTLGGNKKTCNDINECRLFEPCAQRCDNTFGSYRCSCYNGFMLSNDKLGCKSIHGNGYYMLYTTADQIRKISQNPSTISVVHSFNASTIVGMDINMKRNLLYFSVQYSDSLYEYDIIKDKILAIENIGNPGKISVDWITNNVYFIDSDDNSRSIIKVCNMENKQCAKIKVLELRGMITTISVDPINRFLFYTVIHYFSFDRPQSIIYKCKLDGTKSEIITKDLIDVTAISNDFNKRIIYFIDIHTSSVKSVKYDGSELKTVVKTNSYLHNPIAMNIFEDHGYIINHGSNYVTKCKLYGDRECKTFELNVYNAKHLIVVQSTRQKIVSNVCADKKCSVICVAADNGPKCICQRGEYETDAQKCNITKPIIQKTVTEETTSTSNVFVKAVLITLLTFIILGLIAYVSYKNRVKHGKFNIR